MQYRCSTEKEKLDITAIHSYISGESYWGKDRSLEEVQQSIENSLCFGMYDDENTQIGFARVVTDYVVFAYLMDVIIFKPYRGQGHGKRLIQYILAHQSIDKIQTFALKTRDAHQLYEQFGFKKLGNSPLWMARDNKE